MAIDVQLSNPNEDMVDHAEKPSMSFGGFGGGLLDSTLLDGGLIKETTALDEHSQLESRNGETQLSSLSFGSAGLLAMNTIGLNPPSPQPTSPLATMEDIPHIEEHSSFETTSKSPLNFGGLAPSSMNSSFVPLQGTSFDGQRVYFSRRYKRPTLLSKISVAPGQPLNVLQTPFHRLMQEVKQIKASSSDKASTSKDAERAPAKTEVIPNNRLWVDRYKPRTFVELLGDERVHRETMAWVKEWDHCVFGKAKTKRRKRPLEADEGYHYEDEYHRPRERILLISGPPGLGKTTLASVVASQAGYEVMEINASDARTGSVIDDRIRPALEAGSRVGKTKPVLVVIDEIDGATGAGENMGSFVHKLIELTFERSKKKKSRKKNGQDGKRPLLRPIICICNDLYSSSLVRLRSIAKIIRFNKVSDVLLTKRLREICKVENMKIDAHALSTLTRVGQGDIRSCINALQFLSAQMTQSGSNSSEITEPSMRAALVGMKETEGSVASVLSAIFTPPTKKRAKELGVSEQEDAEQQTYFVDRLSRVIDLTGAHEKVALGCFEHYCTHEGLHDLSKYEKAHRWLGSFDLLSGAVRSDREYAVMQYLSYSLVPFYILFAQRGGRRIESSKADWEHFQSRKANEEIYKSLLKCLGSPSTMVSESKETDALNVTRTVDLRHLLGTPVLQLEFAPLLNRIISPPLRPVNRQIIRADERATLSRLVSIMISLDLQFILDRNEEGQPIYRLEPPIEAFVTYDGKRTGDIPPPRFATRQVVASEIEQALERKKRPDGQSAIKEKAPANSFFAAPPPSSQHQTEEEPIDTVPDLDDDGHGSKPSLSRAQMRNFNQDMSVRQAKKAKIDPADKPPTDFFGRPLQVKPKPVQVAPSVGETGAVAAIRKARVSYRYNEGSSAAVRKPIKVAALLL